MDAADGAVVLVEAVEEGAHAVVPHLDHPAVEAGQDPWPPRVEAQPLHPVALRLELGQHLRLALPPLIVVSGDGGRGGGGGGGGEPLAPEAEASGGEGRRWIWGGVEGGEREREDGMVVRLPLKQSLPILAVQGAINGGCISLFS